MIIAKTEVAESCSKRCAGVWRKHSNVNKPNQYAHFNRCTWVNLLIQLMIIKLKFILNIKVIGVHF